VTYGQTWSLVAFAAAIVAVLLAGVVRLGELRGTVYRVVVAPAAVSIGLPRTVVIGRVYGVALRYPGPAAGKVYVQYQEGSDVVYAWPRHLAFSAYSPGTILFSIYLRQGGRTISGSYLGRAVPPPVSFSIH
jgi:hypothetical protein